MKEKNKKKYLEILKGIWFVRLWKFFERDKSMCPICKTNPYDKEYGGKCFHCYFLGLSKETFERRDMKK